MVLLSIAISCNEKKDTIQDIKKSEVSVNESKTEIEAIPHYCFAEATGKDTVFVMLDDNLGTVTGKMYYKNYQKDSSTGTLAGSVSGDTIKAEYTFDSEGVTSTREIWFLKKDGKLYEGAGEMDETGEKYKSTQAVKFEGGRALHAAECKGFEKNFAVVTTTEKK